MMFLKTNKQQIKFINKRIADGKSKYGRTTWSAYLEARHMGCRQKVCEYFLEDGKMKKKNELHRIYGDADMSFEYPGMDSESSD